MRMKNTAICKQAVAGDGGDDCPGSHSDFQSVRSWCATGTLSIAAIMSGVLAMLSLAATDLVASTGNKIGFDEVFALAEDRAAVLEQLIPGTEAYYYYHCLHYQHTGDTRALSDTLALWIKRHGYTRRVDEIRNRQALLTYAANPRASLDRIVDTLALRFDHQKERLDEERVLPTALDASRISRERLTAEALSAYPESLNGFEDSALEFLSRESLSTERLRDLLRRLRRPDIPGLPGMVVKDLNNRHSGGFGSHAIHAQMLISQLDECLRLMPELLNHQQFIHAYLTKLQPDNDVNRQQDAAAERAYLERLWAFVDRLPSAQNSLKANILYRRLTFDEQQGELDHERFIRYLKLPRTVGYLNHDFFNRTMRNEARANLRVDFTHIIGYPPVIADEPLVRRCLQHFLNDARSPRAFADYLRQDYLDQLFAETKIVSGDSDVERWASMLSPEQFQSLKERIDLDFLPTNMSIFAAEAPVEVGLAIKNVSTLIVKTYVINSFGYYREHAQELSTGINLDGLVANHERIVEYKYGPLRRHVETFSFPELDAPGVYVIDFIGNGRSSRALIRKGRLTYLERIGAAGHVFTVLDGAGAIVDDAEIWLDGHLFAADDSDEIVIPFSTNPGTAQIILRSGNAAALHAFTHQAESYDLRTAFLVDREALQSGRNATVAVRPMLLMAGIPVDLSLLSDVTLVVESTDLQGVSTTTSVPDFEVFGDRESTWEFRTPERLQRLRATLTATVAPVTQGEPVSLAASRVFELNGIDRTSATAALFLARAGDRWSVQMLGKNGEPKSRRPVDFDLKHREFRQLVHVTLQTDELGRIELGNLKDITRVQARTADGAAWSWTPGDAAYVWPEVIHGDAGEAVRVPVFDPAFANSDSISILERRGESYVRDVRDAVTFSDGFLVIKGLEPGDYDLFLKPDQTSIRIRLTAGKAIRSWRVSRDRMLETRHTAPLHIVDVGVNSNADAVLVQLANATPQTRVHVIASRFVPDYDTFSGMALPPSSELKSSRINMAESRYVSGRNIGDEYRYVLERKYTQSFPGNMLTRPSLLLNPWRLRDTDTGVALAQAGDDWADMAESPLMASRSALNQRQNGGGALAAETSYATMDFLPTPSVVILNQRPDNAGRVRVSRDLLGTRRHVHVLAVDAMSTVYRQIALDAVEQGRRDRRLKRPLPAAKHFLQEDAITTVKSGGRFVVDDITSTTLEMYDSLAAVYALFKTLSGNDTLTEFGFILDWPKLDAAAKRAAYSEHACHELNVFLYHKDPEFFEAVVQPYLKNKLDPTYLDHWLLGDDLSRYLEPWEFNRLNCVEQILLAQRKTDRAAAIRRELSDRFDLLVPDPELQRRLFNTALRGRGLDTADRLGYRQAAAEEVMKQEAMKKAKASSQRHSDFKEHDERLSGRLARESEAMPMAVLADMAVAADARTEAAMIGGQAAGKALAMDDDRRRMKNSKRDLARRREQRVFFRKADTTQEWVENNYYNLPIEQQTAALITINAFWKDYADKQDGGLFLSRHVAAASGNFAEMMLALAVLDLPFYGGEHETTYDDARMSLGAAGNAIVFHREVRETAAVESSRPVLLSQNFFALDDRYRYEGNERFDKFVSDEFVIDRVYGCQVVLTNPTSARRALDVLMQIPGGAIPVSDSEYTRSRNVVLEPYSTRTFEVYMYFPEPGDFTHFPVHVAENQHLVAFAAPTPVHVVADPTKVDTESWAYISQHADSAAVLQFIADSNIHRIDLGKIAFRMRDRDFFGKVIACLEERLAYDHTLWSYGLYHNDVAVIQNYLKYSPFADQCGLAIDTDLLVVDPVERHHYQHREYWPLINARTYQLGADRKILNNQFHEQYHAFLETLRYRPALTDIDLINAGLYLLLQDRVRDALNVYARTAVPAGIHTRIQYDYLAAYLAFYQSKPGEARTIASRYADHPVDRWRRRFTDIIGHAEEITGASAAVADPGNRDQQHSVLADTEPVLDFGIVDRMLTLNYRNLERCRLQFYPMDIELLFSENPFAHELSGQFTVIQPHSSLDIELPVGETAVRRPLPEAYHGQNVMVEVAAAGHSRFQTYTPHTMTVQIIENYGHLLLTTDKTDQRLAQAYVKVYARMKDGRELFYKDGYTDLRGRFDYASLSTNELEQVERFAILINSDRNGAVIRTAAPPKL